MPANCSQLGLHADVQLGLAIADARIAREKEASAAILAFVFAPAMPGEIAAAEFHRAAAKVWLELSSTALKAVGECFSDGQEPGCAQKIWAIKGQLDVWVTAMTAGRPDLSELIAALEQLRKQLNSDLAGCRSIVLEPYETHTEAADVDLVLLLTGGFGNTGSRRYAQPTEETQRSDMRFHWIEARPGSIGPRFLARCKVFDVTSWRLSAEARVAGAALSHHLPFQFAWEWDGKPVSAGVLAAPTSSSAAFTVASQTAGKRLAVTATSGGISLQASVFVGVPKTREECVLIPK